MILMGAPLLSPQNVFCSGRTPGQSVFTPQGTAQETCIYTAYSSVSVHLAIGAFSNWRSNKSGVYAKHISSATPWAHPSSRGKPGM